MNNDRSCRTCRHFVQGSPASDPCFACGRATPFDRWEPLGQERIETDHRGAPPVGASPEMPLAPPSRGDVYNCLTCHHLGVPKTHYPCSLCDAGNCQVGEQPNHWQRHIGAPVPRGVLRSPDAARYFDKHGVHPQDYPHPQSQADRSGAARPAERVISVRDLRATIKPRIDARKRNAGDILVEMGDTFRERNKVYGSNYKMVAPLVRVLFPDGVPPELVASHRWHLFELKLVKLSRFAISGLKHVDSIHDDAVYSAMIEAILTNGEDQ